MLVCVESISILFSYGVLAALWPRASVRVRRHPGWALGFAEPKESQGSGHEGVSRWLKNNLHTNWPHHKAYFHTYLNQDFFFSYKLHDTWNILPHIILFMNSVCRTPPYPDYVVMIRISFLTAFLTKLANYTWLTVNGDRWFSVLLQNPLPNGKNIPDHFTTQCYEKLKNCF